MKKILSLVLICLLVMGATAYGATNYGTENAVIFGPQMGGTGTVAPTEIVKVRYSYRPPVGAAAVTGNIASGDVLVWDTTSADGFTVSQAVGVNPAAYAGVAVTTILTAENSTVKGIGRNIGYMAIRGYCLAKGDTSSATTGQRLFIRGGDGSEATATAFGTVPVAATQGVAVGEVSQDIGVLLTDPAADGLMRVWLK